ncbi:MAG TPA: tRNA lysidine(34) synthetase TilS [Gemmataceae bacterium]
MDRARFEARLRRALRRVVPADTPGVVAVSGGGDSVTLLHALCFLTPERAAGAVVVHVDHAMRPGSERDAAWVRGLARAWGRPARVVRLAPPPRTETEARRQRRAALRAAAADVGGRWILLAHHADDQAETVLFRALRGSGPTGLQGMRPRSGPWLRPLLGFWRDELRAWARARGLRWREDPTNRDPRIARNRLRAWFPDLERTVAPGARRSLARLAALLRRDEAAWRWVERELIRSAIRAEDDGWTIPRATWRAWPRGVQARVLRRLLRSCGVVPTYAGTAFLLRVMTEAASGRRVALGRRVVLDVVFDHVRLRRPRRPDDGPTEALLDSAAGEAETVGLGRRWRWRWHRGPAPGSDRQRAALPTEIRGPLRIRPARPGDRVLGPGGTRRLKRYFREWRVPGSERWGRPVLVDGADRVLWVPLLSPPAWAAAPGTEAWIVEFVDADTD